MDKCLQLLDPLHFVKITKYNFTPLYEGGACLFIPNTFTLDDFFHFMNKFTNCKIVSKNYNIFPMTFLPRYLFPHCILNTSCLELKNLISFWNSYLTVPPPYDKKILQYLNFTTFKQIKKDVVLKEILI